MRRKFLMTLALGLTLALTPAAVLADPGVNTGVEAEAGETEDAENPDDSSTEDEEVEETETAGWRDVTDESGTVHRYYYEEDSEGNLVQVTGAQKTIDGKNYLFDENGDLCTGFHATTEDGKSICYYDEDGVQYTGTGWVEQDGKNYYMKNDHLLVDGDGLTGAFVEQSSGEKIAWLSVDGAWYLLDAEEGYRLSGWQEAKTALYYLNPDNGDKMETGDSAGWKLIDGTWYNFQSWGGARRSCWYQHKNCWYYFHEDGAMQSGGSIEYKGSTYFFYSWGGMYHDAYVTTENGTYYTLSWGGALKNGWSQDSNGIYHYHGADAVMLKSQEFEYKSRLYYVDENGNMLSNAWRQIGSDWYYYLSWGGRARSEWAYYKSNYYYFDKNGVMMHDRWLDPSDENNTNPSNKIYYLRSWGGRCASGQYTIDGKTYSFDSNGRRVDAGYFMQNGYRYYRNADGSICYDIYTVDPNYVKSCSKRITVDRSRGIVTVYGYYNGSYNTPLISMYCSVGKAGTATPYGTYYTGWKMTKKKMVGDDYVCWAPYVTQITGAVYFHGVASDNDSLSAIIGEEFDALGTPRSHGCVRLAACQAKWIYQYCKGGTRVDVGDNMANPLPNPVRYRWSGPPIGSDPTWTGLSSSDYVA